MNRGKSLSGKISVHFTPATLTHFRRVLMDETGLTYEELVSYDRPIRLDKVAAYSIALAIARAGVANKVKSRARRALQKRF